MSSPYNCYFMRGEIDLPVPDLRIILILANKQTTNCVNILLFHSSEDYYEYGHSGESYESYGE